jgi:hypothetical protein
VCDISVYSEEKSQLLRRERDKCSEADGELAARIASMQLPENLDRLKMFFKEMKGFQQAKGDVPGEVLEWTASIRKKEKSERLATVLDRLNSVRSSVNQNLTSIESILAQDGQQYLDLKVRR